MQTDEAMTREERFMSRVLYDVVVQTSMGGFEGRDLMRINARPDDTRAEN